MIGHNPGLENMLMTVLQAKQAASIQKMATGTLTVIEFSNGFRREAASGSLVHLIRRKDLSPN